MKNVEDIYRLSPMQRGMLFHTLYSPGAGTYIEQVYWTWRQAVDARALRRAFQRLVARHTPLRTAYFWEGLPEPMQAVRRKAELPWEELDWQGVPEEEQRQRFDELLLKDQERGFSLSTSPVSRFTLVKLGPARYRCIWSYHHMALDGWSAPVALKEVFLDYVAMRQGQELELAPARPFRDYIAWLAKQDAAEAERYWRQALQGFTSATPVGGEPEGAKSHEARASYVLKALRMSAAATARLGAFGRQHQLTLGTLVHAAWGLLLGHYSGERDVAFGTVVSGRPASLPGVEQMLGLFINTLVVRVRLPAETEVVSWLKQLQAEQLEARRYEYVALTDVQGYSQVPRGQPLFHSFVAMENTPELATLELSTQLAMEGFARTAGRTGSPLTLVVVPGTELLLQLVHDANRFPAATIERMLAHLARLLEALTENAGNPLWRLTPLTEAERKLLARWNETWADFPREACAHHLVEAQVERTPDAVAARYEGQELTYRQLDARANQLAHHLRTLGVGPETRVGLCAERSLEFVVGLLGILKAGGAYVPLEPSYPRERLASMLGDSRVSVLLTQERLVARLPPHGAQVLCLDSEWESVARLPASVPPQTATADNLAYIIFTSGSTGRPKGTLLAHRGLCNTALAAARAHGFEPGLRVLQFAASSFDASVCEVFATLVAGGTLVLAPRESLMPGEPLRHLLHSQRIGAVTLTPSALAQLAPGGLPHLRTVISAGEACTPELAKKWSREHTLLNAYGPTEATVCATITPGSVDPERLTIGRAWPNTRLYVLDAWLQQVPVGLVGELYIGGEGLARGYLGRAELTAERFIPDPFSSEPGARMYRTGDNVRWLPDGSLEYVGRLDHQVKLRGFRIEPGEIESVLRDSSLLQDVLVMAREDSPGNKRLVAYAVPSPGRTVDASVLRSALHQRVPEYMVPSAFVMLEALPLTPNGKVDHKALPPPDFSASASASFVAPRDALEQTLAGVWEELLCTQPVSVTQSFFELGGHSLLAVRLVSRLERQLGRKLPLSTLFTHSTIEHLASLLRQDGSSSQWTPLVPLQPSGMRRPLFLVHPIGGGVLCYAPLTRHLGVDQPVYGLEASGLDGSREPLSSIESMASRYIEALCQVQSSGPYLLGGWSLGGVVAFEMARQLSQLGQSVERLVLLDSWVPALAPEVAFPAPGEASLLVAVAQDLARAVGRELCLPLEELAPLQPGARLSLLLERARAVGALPADVGTPELGALISVFRAHALALQRYSPPRDYRGPVDLFRPEDGLHPVTSEPSGGWASVTHQPPRLHSTPGDHYTLLTEPRVEALAQRLRQLLEPQELAMSR